MEGCREKGGREEGATSVQAGAVGLQQSSGRGVKSGDHRWRDAGKGSQTSSRRQQLVICTGMEDDGLGPGCLPGVWGGCQEG